ncbi:hypothetical protein C8R44DRAFT_755328 [Mycena epipterygia]|nr:hypothetical protein C8R44DRAFT_755328 [Mycena epipterygia]
MGAILHMDALRWGGISTQAMWAILHMDVGAILDMDALKPEGYINAGHPGYGRTEAGAAILDMDALKPEWYINASNGGHPGYGRTEVGRYINTSNGGHPAYGRTEVGRYISASNVGCPAYGRTEAGAVYQRKQLQAVLKPEWYIHAVLHMDTSNAEAGAVYQCNASNPGAVGSINAADRKGSKARKQGHQNEVEEGRTALSIAALSEGLPYAAHGAAEIDNIELGRGCTCRHITYMPWEVEYHDQELGPKRATIGPPWGFQNRKNELALAPHGCTHTGCHCIVIGGNGLGGTLFGTHDLGIGVGPNDNCTSLEIPFIPMDSYERKSWTADEVITSQIIMAILMAGVV